MLGNFLDFNIFADFPFKNDFYIEQWSNFWKTLQAKTSFRLDPKGLIKSMANYKKLGLVRRGLRKLNVEKSRLVQLPAQFLSFFAFERASKLGGTSTSEFIFQLSNSIWSISTVIQNLRFNLVGRPFHRKKWPGKFYHIFATFSPIGDGHLGNVLSYSINGSFFLHVQPLRWSWCAYRVSSCPLLWS